MSRLPCQKALNLSITQRDLRLLDAVARFGAVERSWLRGVFYKGRSEGVARRRLKRLKALGLLSHQQLEKGPRALRLSRQGIGQVVKLLGRSAEELSFTRAYSSQGSLNHLLRTAQVALGIESLGLNLRVRSEPQVCHDGFRFQSQLRSGRRWTHQPDLLISLTTHSQALLALEVELTAKSKKRVLTNLEGYWQSPSVAYCLYLCSSSYVQENLEVLRRSLWESLSAQGDPLRADKILIVSLEEFLKSPLECRLGSLQGPKGLLEVLEHMEDSASWDHKPGFRGVYEVGQKTAGSAHPYQTQAEERRFLK